MNYLFFILFSAFSSYYQQTETVDITVVVTNITTLEGSIELGVFNTSKSFLNKGEEYRTYSQKATNNTLTFHLKGLKKDDYAISLYQDINSDGKCNLNVLLRPSEPYGFSNNIKLKLFKPSFDDCKLTADKNMVIKIKLVE
ncbi:MAG TPA: DUF2141 domain-containing protein [Brumimicrobium sp.]|nr:DUF2141 domain-containing protein [Brumimicrobium sp.]